MASSLAAAFAEVDGPRLDLIRGYLIPPRKHAPTDEGLRIAFSGFDYNHHVGGIVRTLARRLRRHEADAEDAAQDAFLELLCKYPERLREDPARCLGWVYSVAYHRLVKANTRGKRAESIERLTEVAGDALLATARPCVPPAPEVDEESKYAPAPRRGEEWTQTQITGAFQRFRDFHGRPPKLAECKLLHGLPSPATIYRHFDGFAAAILAAGMVPETLGRRRKAWAPIEAARTCEVFRKRHGRWPDRGDAECRSGELPGPAVMVRYFGGTRSGEVQQGAEAILAGARVAPTRSGPR
jgi:DNA-directed RNA polymerase specialized sigma24 family protein